MAEAGYNVVSQNVRRTDQGAKVTENSENKRIATDTYRGQNDTDGDGVLEATDNQTTPAV